MASPASSVAASAASARLWRAAQWIALAATITLLGGLVAWPEPSLLILWSVLIPLVPASLLISPMLWRNVCPLATLNLLSNRKAGSRILGVKVLPVVGLVGIALLVVLVPARRFLFNTDGLALAVTVAAVAAAAFASGALFDIKAGFCNSVCPVLPVERLYGQHPLMRVGNPRCTPCTMCTAKACIDLGPTRSIAVTIGPARESSAWLRTAYGAFAAAFPGFIVGYFTLTDGPLATWSAVYLNIALWSLGSWAITFAIVSLFRIRSELALVLLAAAAVAIYYWYTADAVTRAFDVVGMPTLAIRIVALALVLAWTWRAIAAASHPRVRGAAGVGTGTRAA